MRKNRKEDRPRFIDLREGDMLRGCPFPYREYVAVFVGVMLALAIGWIATEAFTLINEVLG